MEMLQRILLLRALGVRKAPGLDTLKLELFLSVNRTKYFTSWPIPCSPIKARQKTIKKHFLHKSGSIGFKSVGYNAGLCYHSGRGFFYVGILFVNQSDMIRVGLH
jgi:hypothetical protein